MVSKSKPVGALLFVLLLFSVAASACSVSSSQATGTSTTAAEVPTGAEFSACEAGPDIGSVGPANGLLTSAPDAAKEIYLAILSSAVASTEERRCAEYGLAALASAAPKTTATTPVQEAADRWDSVFESWVSPGSQILALLAIFLALGLLLSRILTSVLVQPQSPGPSTATGAAAQWYRASYGANLVLIIASACLLTVAVTVSTEQLHPLWILAFAVVCAASVVTGLQVLMDGRARAPGAVAPVRQGHAVAFWVTLVAVLLLVSTLLLLAAVVPLAGAGIFVFVAGVISGVVGAGQLGYVRGLRLGMLIEGRAADGAAKGGSANLVMERLYMLGARSPRGIVVPEQSDVSELPDDALALLPDGGLSKAWTMIKEVFRPAKPWRLVINETDQKSVEVVLLRNGKVIDAQLIQLTDIGFARPAAALPDSSGTGKQPAAAATDSAAAASEPGTAELYTAAAAFVLMELSRRYRYLVPGLSGATEWRSLAAQAIAAPKARADTAIAKQLLGFARNVDPGNLTVRYADVLVRHGMDQDLDNSTKMAEKLELLLVDVQDHLKKFDITQSALQLRVLFNLTVGYANSQQWLPAKSASDKLDLLLTAETEAAADLRDLRGEMHDSFRFVSLFVHMKAAPGISNRWTELGPWRNTWKIKSGQGNDLDGVLASMQPVTTLGYYERSCVYAIDGNFEKSLDDLDRVVTAAPRWKKAAVQDFSFDQLKADPTFGKRFYSMVGEQSPASLLDLAEFKEHAAALRDLGITDAAGILAVPDYVLATAVDTSVLQVHWWRGICEMWIGLLVDGKPTSPAHVALLLADGVTGRARLATSNPATLTENLLSGRTYDTPPPTLQCVSDWVAAAK